MEWSLIWKKLRDSFVAAFVKPWTWEAGLFLSGECSLSKSHCQVVMSEGMSRLGCWDLYVGILSFFLVYSQVLSFSIPRSCGYEAFESGDGRKLLDIYEGRIARH